jgi:hypothetical protein
VRPSEAKAKEGFFFYAENAVLFEVPKKPVYNVIDLSITGCYKSIWEQRCDLL